ncbi:MAG: TonB-dependent receptor [Cytophagales bacterium]|nr:TonB-dependent receptor [Cytophagales bacterium]
MKNNYLKQLYMLSKLVFYGFVLQLFFFSFLIASNTDAQIISKVSDVYIDLNDKNMSVGEVFDLIESKTSFEFLYIRQDIHLEKKVNVRKGHRSVKDLLLEISKNTGLSFKQINNNINVHKKEYVNKDEPIEIIIQGITITGKVTSAEDSEGLPGVNVVVKGTSQGTVTDVEGNFKLEVPDENSILVFSSVGYVQEEVAVGTRTVINMSMVPDITALDEIVVVGYGSQKKADLTGSVSNVPVEDLESRAITSLSAGLSGLAPGVHVMQGSGGRIGSDNAVIRIRGVGTLNNANPLVLVDGVASSMNDIDPNDIANISILKDAASAAIYGSRAANGVILITTKTGTQGTPSISYNGYAGWQQATKKEEYVSDFATWMELANENRTNGGGAPLFTQAEIDEWRNSNDPLTHPNVDWYDLQTGGKAFLQSHTLAVSGGTEKTTYRFSLGYLDQDGLQKPNNQKRYSARAYIDTEIAKGFKLGTNLFYRWTNLNPTVNTSNGTGVDFNLVPAIPDIKSPDGRWGGSQHSSLGIVTSPYWNVSLREQNNRSQRLLGSIFADWEIIKGLRFKTTLSLNSNTSLNRSFQKTGENWNFREGTIDREVVRNSGSSTHNQNYLITNFYTLEYEKSFGDHNLKALGGYQYEIYRSDRVSASVRDFPSNSLQVLDAGLNEPGVGGNASEWTLMSYFGRLNYAFKDKYLFEANVRRDGSSRFREGKKWGTFPSFSVGWRISEEAFLRNVSFLSDLKIRGSWGQLGNQQIGSASNPNNYPYQPTYDVNQNYSFGGTVVSGIAQTRLTNQDITWETTTTTNIALDAGLFDNRLELTFEYFNRETDGILEELPIPQFLGDKDEPTVNLAEVVNKGWEASISYRGKIGNDIEFGAGAHITQLENEVTKYFGETVRSGGTFIIQEGYPIRSIYGFEALGIFQSQEEIDDPGTPTHPGAVAPGDIRYKDQLTEDTDGDGIPDAGDGQIDSNDRTVIGNTIPKYLLGGNLNVQYKNFDLGIILQGVLDVDTYAGNNFAFQAFNQNDRGLLSKQWLNRWTPENPTNWPRLVESSAYDGNRDRSSFWVDDISYIRLKNIQLGYTIPSNTLNKYGIEKIRIYASSDNLLTFTNWKWNYDPERTQTATLPGLPNLTTFVFGLNVQF